MIEQWSWPFICALLTESLVCEASKKVLAAHGAELTPACVAAGMGKRPLEAWQVQL